jgi:hypothetical protein
VLAACQHAQPTPQDPTQACALRAGDATCASATAAEPQPDAIRAVRSDDTFSAGGGHLGRWSAALREERFSVGEGGVRLAPAAPSQHCYFLPDAQMAALQKRVRFGVDTACASLVSSGIALAGQRAASVTQTCTLSCRCGGAGNMAHSHVLLSITATASHTSPFTAHKRVAAQAEQAVAAFAKDFRQFWEVVSNNEATVSMVDVCLSGAYALGILDAPYRPWLPLSKIGETVAILHIMRCNLCLDRGGLAQAAADAQAAVALTSVPGCAPCSPKAASGMWFAQACRALGRVCVVRSCLSAPRWLPVLRLPCVSCLLTLPWLLQ